LKFNLNLDFIKIYFLLKQNYR